MDNYLKYILYLIAIIAVVWVNRKLLTDPQLRKWLMGSFEEANTHKASGKSLSAFIFCVVIALATLISIHYSKDHIIPEFIFWGVLGLITSLYGIKEVGRMVSGKQGNVNGNGTTADPQTQKALDTPKLIELLKAKHIESKSELSFEDWLKEQISIEPEPSV
jgi:hypothetical protein